MITIKNLYSVNSKEFDECWAIVRSYRKPIEGIVQVPELAPSSTLFFNFLQLKKQNLWNKDRFEQFYVPRFLQEMKAPIARQKLNEILIKDRLNKHICLSCFCYDEFFCHRSIVAGLLQGAGCQVITENNKDYSNYFNIYLRSE